MRILVLLSLAGLAPGFSSTGARAAEHASLSRGRENAAAMQVTDFGGVTVSPLAWAAGAAGAGRCAGGEGGACGARPPVSEVIGAGDDRPGPDGDGQSWGSYQLLTINADGTITDLGLPPLDLGGAAGAAPEYGKPVAAAGGEAGGGSRPQPVSPTGEREVALESGLGLPGGGKLGSAAPGTGQGGGYPPVSGQGVSVSPAGGGQVGVVLPGQLGTGPLQGGPGGAVTPGSGSVGVLPSESGQAGMISAVRTVPPMSASSAAVPPESGHVWSVPPSSGPATAVPPGSSQSGGNVQHSAHAAKPLGSFNNPGSQPTAAFKVKPNMTVEALDLGTLVVLASMHRNLVSQSEARGDILTSLSHASLPPAPRRLAQLFLARLVGLARAALPGPGSSPGWVPLPPAPNGRLLQPWDTASIVLLCTLGEVNGVRGRAISAPALGILAAFASMSRLTAVEEGLLTALNCEQLAQVLVQSTLGLPDGAAMGSPVLSTWNLSELLLVILGVELPAATAPDVRNGVAALALTLYECVADNGKLPASSDKVEMVNRILVQRYHSPHTVSLQPRAVSNAQLLARALKGIPPVASARVNAPTASIPPPISPNPSFFPPQKMKHWRSMNLCTDLILRLAGLQWSGPDPASALAGRRRVHIKS